jgi:hypothetical protein
MNIEEMLAEIRNIISLCKEPERDVLEALLAEAEGWEMRWQEFEAADDQD